jgi:signal transduction histidine kinase/ActR/RegA family two-component response regulator
MHALRTDSPVSTPDTEPAILLQALLRLREGACDAHLPPDWDGMWGCIAGAFNAVVEQHLRLSRELARLAQVVGREGRLKERAHLPDAGGFWVESAQAVNALIAALVHPTSDVARVIGAVAQGDLSKSMATEVDGRPLQGEFLRTATVINRMVQQLGTFSAEVTRVAREVGTEGKLGGQADVQGVAGTWKDLTDNVNSMASNLTSQVRNIADVTKAVAAGDLSRKITVDVQGEILGLKNTINTMVDQLRAFAAEVTRVAREVGAEGMLGGQAQVPGAAGTWKALTENVNRLAANLTTQVRAIAEVATAVTQGDLTRSVTVQACGEVAALKDTINEMIRNLRDTTRLNTEQDWLKTQLAQELQSRQLELQHTNEALQEKARQVAQTSRYKSEFLANMSHELRTPLNSLLILSEQLARNAEGNLSARQVEFARTIHSSGHDLLMLINDILDLSKIESGTVVVDLSELRLSELQRYLERNFRHVAEARAVDFQLDCALRPSMAIRTDVKRLQQILKNLLSNAFKFTLHGAVKLDIREVREGWSPQHPQLSQARRVVAFAVSDTGIGIPSDKQQIIFDAFQQADGSTSRKYGGTGLGLAISRELSRLLGGEICLASTPGQGSIFTLYLPLRCASVRAAPASRPARRTPAGTRRSGEGDTGGDDEVTAQASCPLAGQRVLIVDDDMRNIFALATVLEEHGMDIVWADNGREAIQRVDTDARIRVVLMDIMMPELDGLATLREIRRLPRGRELPLIAVTAQAMKGDREKCIEAGAWDYLAKPVNPHELLTALRAWVQS